MDPYSGQMYTKNQIETLPEKVKDRLVEVEGKPEHVERMSRAIKHYNNATSNDKSKRKKARKEARKSRKKNRK